MSAIMELPNDPENLSEAIEVLLAPAIRYRNVHQIGWWITDAYIQGMRDFNILDMAGGQLEVSYEEEDGGVHLRWEEPLTRIATEVGRLARLDLGAKATKRRNALESLRASSVAQVLLDQQDSLVDSATLDLQFLIGLVQYGTYGTAAWRDDTKQSPLAIVQELIPPGELLFIPAGFSNPTDKRIICRTRLFPLAQLVKMRGVKQNQIDEKELELIELPYGANISQSVAGPGFGRVAGGAGLLSSLVDEEPSGQTKVAGQIARRKITPAARTEQFVRLREVLVLGPGGYTVDRYIARAGRAIVLDTLDTWRDKMVPIPIGIGYYQDTGHAYGRSFAGKIVPFALEMEGLLERLFANAADFDRFGFTLVPLDRGIDFEGFAASEEPRILGYQEDVTKPGTSGVEQFLPTTATDIPGRLFQNLGLPTLDRITAQGPLYSGQTSGREDSAVAINSLEAGGSTHLIPTAKSIAAAFTARRRFQLHEIRQRFTDPDQLTEGIPLSRIENTIAGVKIDPQTGRVMLTPDDLPDPWGIHLGIQSEDPLARDRRRQEGLFMLGSETSPGLLSPLEFYILNYKEGWDYPVDNKVVYEQYVKAVLYNLILFNDGETPGELPYARPALKELGVYFLEMIDKPEIHELAIEDFVSGPEVALATIPVQTAFINRLKDVKIRMGRELPEGMPTLEQAAADSAARKQATQQQGAQGNAPQGPQIQTP